MGPIFANARSLLILLGEADELSNLASRWMPWIAGGPNNVPEEPKRNINILYEDVAMRPWFGRVEVMQEMTLAKQESVVVWSKETVP